MKVWVLLLSFFCSTYGFAGVLMEVEDRQPAYEEEGVPLVEKEFMYIKSAADFADTIEPYKKRRESWGLLVGFGYTFYQPINYQPNFQPDYAFDGLYDDSGMFDLNITAKYHFALGSLGLGVGLGYYKTESLSGAPAESTMTVMPFRAEASLILDTLTKEPYIAPYGLAGVYTNFYKEEQSGSDSEEASSFNGNTAIAMYIGGGINFQMDWMEPKAGVATYVDYGMENTFLFIEGKKYITSSSEDDPDFETDFLLTAGAKIEY
jgi:hypothetical protein